MRRVERKTRREIIWLDSAYLAGILLILLIKPKSDGVNTKKGTEDQRFRNPMWALLPRSDGPSEGPPHEALESAGIRT